MRYSNLFLTFLILLFIFSFSQVSDVKAAATDNVLGWAYSENIGWISFNSTNCDIDDNGYIDSGDCGGDNSTTLVENYGVNIEPDGNMTGYAWSEYTDYIDFNPSSGYPEAPNYSAQVDLNTKEISGWARAQAFGDGWDGWIKMRGTWTDPVYIDDSLNPPEFRGYAWGDTVVGWISFNDEDFDGSPGPVDYQVTTSAAIFNQAPTASFSCYPDGCEQSAGACTGWTKSSFCLRNNSTDPDGQADIKNSIWNITGTMNDTSNCLDISGNRLCDWTLLFTFTAGNYNAELSVVDQAEGLDTTNQGFTIRQDLEVDFRCSFNNLDWQDCDSSDFKPSVDEKIYLGQVVESTTFSEGASSFLSFNWSFPLTSSYENEDTLNPSVIFSDITDTEITFTGTDNQNRTDSVSYTIGATLPLPEWKEISPFGLATFPNFVKQNLGEFNQFFAIIGQSFNLLF